MVDREVFDDWLRERAAARGRGAAHRALRATRPRRRRRRGGPLSAPARRAARRASACARALVIGADGARLAGRRQAVPGADKMRYVFAYHEIIEAPTAGAADFDAARCDVYLPRPFSPDFYGWVFPHGDTASIGTGSAAQGLLAARRGRAACGQLGPGRRRDHAARGRADPAEAAARWDNGRDVVLAGDAAGVVAPASGEGIYYAMLGGRLAAEAVDAFLATGDARALRWRASAS